MTHKPVKLKTNTCKISIQVQLCDITTFNKKNLDGHNKISACDRNIDINGHYIVFDHDNFSYSII